MSVLYNQFCITNILPDLKTKTIVIETNFKVDASTINLNTVTLYDYSAGSGQLTEYSLYVEGKNICIILKDFPPPETRYYLKVTDIYDALNRKINHAYNDYIVFTNDVITSVEILSPGYRETYTQNMINVKLKITDALAEGAYKIQVSSDNTFFKTLSIVTYSATNKELSSSDDTVTITSDNSNEEEVNFIATVDYNGQLYIRARAEKTESEVGRWSDMVPFTINTIPVDSLDSTFLDQSLTTFDLFSDELMAEPLAISNKTTVTNIEDGMFYLEFNKEIIIPEEYELTEDGYIDLGTIIGFRKELE